ncbi:MAG: hypothetical protein RL385_760 [Pseudomonadota bacterium]
MKLWSLCSLLVACVVSVSACRGKPDAPPEPAPVCSLRLPSHLAHTQPDALPADIWYALLIKGYQPGSVPTDAVDCSGEPIAWPEVPESCTEHGAEGVVSSPNGRLADQLIVRHAGDDFWFGWAPLWTLDNGMVQGPIAIVRSKNGRLEARALGTLRAYRGRARLEVHHLPGGYVLSAEGEKCDLPEKGGCVRAIRLMYLDRQRFRGRPLRASSIRSCLAPAWFPLSEAVKRKLDKRWVRTLQRNMAFGFTDYGIAVDESIRVFDTDASQPSLPARLFREAQSHINIRVVDGEFLSEGQSLWRSIRLEDASLQDKEGGRSPF